MKTRRHFRFPIDTNQVHHTKVVQKLSLSYSPHAHVQPIQTFVWKPVAILDSLSIPIKFPIQKSYRNQVCRTAPRSRTTYTNFFIESRRHFGFHIDTNQAPHTKVVQKPNLSYSSTLTYSLYKLLYGNPSPFGIPYRPP